MSGVISTGLVQAVKFELSILHSICLIPTPLCSLRPLSLPENVNAIEVDLVLSPLTNVPLFPSIAALIAVVGGNVSTVQLNDSGEGSLFVELSTDKTSKA